MKWEKKILVLKEFVNKHLLVISQSKWLKSMSHILSIYLFFKYTFKNSINMKTGLKYQRKQIFALRLLFNSIFIFQNKIEYNSQCRRDTCVELSFHIQLGCFTYVKMKLLSHVRLFATPWMVACQAPWSMGFSRQEYWNGLPFPSLGDLPSPGIEPGSPALQTDVLPSEPLGKPTLHMWIQHKNIVRCKKI